MLRKSAIVWAFTAFCFFTGLNVQAQTTVIADSGLGTQVASFPLPEPDNPSQLATTVIPGGVLLKVGSGSRTAGDLVRS